MLFHNENHMRPAFAAGTEGGRTSSSERLSRHGFTADASAETDEFGSFRDESARTSRTRRTSAPEGGARRPFFLNKGLLIAIAAAVAAILLIVVIVLIAVNSSQDLRYTDNTYIAYVDDVGNTRIAVNGTEMPEIFTGETRLTTSLDRSFAYVETQNEDGYLMLYLIRNNKLESIIGEDSFVTAVLDYAELTPGIIYAEDNGDIFVYNEEVLMYPITTMADSPDHEPTFMISDDAKTVIYTQTKDNSGGEYTVWCWRDMRSSSLQINNYTPVALSADGVYLYAVSETNRKLYWVNTKNIEDHDMICDSGFGGVTAINVKGDEILYYTSPSEGKMSSVIYSIQKDENFEIAKGKGVFFPAEVNAQTARYDSFSDMYFQSYNYADATSDAASGYTYYMSNSYEPKPIASALGKFSPDGKYFYYINTTKGLLYQYDLHDKENAVPTPLQQLGVVVNFEITAKNNLYVHNANNDLNFYEPSTSKLQPIVRRSLDGMSMHLYANKLYYTIEDMDSVYVTEEGSKGAAASWGKVTPTALPVFVNPNSQKTFVYFEDDTMGTNLLYTANGSNFKVASAECAEIVQSDAPTWYEKILEWMDGVIGGSTAIPSAPTTGNNSNDNATGGGIG